MRSWQSGLSRPSRWCQSGLPIAVVLAALLVLQPAFARDATRQRTIASPGEQCHSAVDAAERRERLPPQLLRSIAVVESGRPDPTTQRVLPWPWTVNVGGTGNFYASSEEAVAAVRAFQANGIRSIDVGCAQINLFYHPHAFNSLENAFDPRANADYAARFLKSLYRATRNWPRAAAAYHSQIAERGEAYAREVMAIWPDAARYGAVAVPAGGIAAAPADYSMYTPEFAARLRRMDEDRIFPFGAGSILDFAWGNRTVRNCSTSQRVGMSVCPPGS